jgi:hypothetical protein
MTSAAIVTEGEPEVPSPRSSGSGGRKLSVDAEVLEHMQDTGLIRIIVGADAEIARAQAVKYRALAEFNRLRRRSRGVAAELAMALAVSQSWAQKMVADAEVLTTRLPKTFALMEDGILDAYRASRVCHATAWLSDGKAREVDLILAERLPGKDATQIRRAATHAAAQADPEGHAAGVRRRRATRKVTLVHRETGTASLAIKDAPVEKMNAAYARLDRAARKLKTQAESRTLDQIRADVATDLLLSGSGGKQERAEVFLYMDFLTYAGLNDDPAELAIGGPIPAELARHIASGPKTVLRRILTDPCTGQALELGKTRYRPKAGLEEYRRVRDRECRGPGCTRPAQFCRDDHLSGHEDESANADLSLIGFCARDNKLKDEPGWSHQVAPDGSLTITSPSRLQHVSRSEPLHDPRPDAG